ncbi:MAG TPA: tRNA pseudouridine(38-40) synthase TruA [Ignavibacteria bacterium]|nr:tRNA pseudouridine(38-40) synthase TruA [Ignavibacteria bacterium]
MKFKIYLEYAGANYSGWQKQPKESAVKTVQGTLMKAIDTVFRKNKGINKFIDLQGSGRTDAGVHAIEQVAHLDCETMLGPEILKMKINDELPGDINILEIEKARPDYHARHSAKSRQYLYVISKRRTAFEKRFVWWVKDKLDVKKMKDASRLFVGMHDFKAFSDKSPDDKSTKCLVESLEITEDANKIYIRIKASHFLWKMVRRIVGALVEVGRGKMKNEEISELLSSLSHKKTAGGFRSPAASGTGIKGRGSIAEFTAPPSGLFLEKIEY